MCGFLVTVGNRWAEAHDAALRQLQHRGPDASGRWDDPREPHVVLGHRRLSIIDLHGSSQPMVSADGRYALAYNGELYNFRELRRELEAHGVRFTTDGDTEVVLQMLVHREPAEALRAFDGMFAFALYDLQEQRLLLARDRFGIKPLFYTRDPEPSRFAAASELTPLLDLPGIDKSLDPHAIRELLAVGSIPAPLSIAKGLECLKPATMMRFNLQGGESEASTYWQVPFATEHPMSRDDFVEAVDAALEESVRRQTVADVPLGCFLSGGIDSSLMASYLAEVTTGAVKTFCVRFPQMEGYDESPHARRVAESIGADHHEFDSRELSGDALGEAISHLDQPFADPAYLPLLALSKLTREHVTVALSGDGGDEVFGGYHRFLDHPASPHPVLALLARLHLLPAKLRRHALPRELALLYQRVRLGPFPGTRKDLAALVDPHIASSLEIDRTMHHWLELVRRFETSPADGLMRADLHTYLSDNCLVKTDRATMAASLEARVPILGNPVVDLVLPQPAELKLGTPEHPRLKDALLTLALRRLPDCQLDRPKHGFSVPLRHDLLGPWKDHAQRWINAAPDLAPWLNQDALRRRWQRLQAGKGEDRTMYTLITLLAWLEEHPLRLDF